MVKNLCEKLLVLDPNKRLGSGTDYTPLSFNALKQHAFFKGVDFTAALKSNPPMDAAILAKLNFDKTKTVSGFESPTELTTSSDSLEDEDEKAPGSGREHEEGKVLKEGTVDKKCGWIFYYKRKLLLTSQPRLSYYVPNTNEYRVSFNTEETLTIGRCADD